MAKIYLEKYVIVRKMGHTYRKIGHTYRIVSHT